ncbi:MAG: hypothetical protein K2M17_03435, partial [Bacilli bacterium]|nr:hypothetical protein [Bacilli bacterium]
DIYDNNYNTDEDAEAPESKTIMGTSTAIPTELRKHAIEYYNKLFPDAEKKITISNFNTYFGSYYLDGYTSPAQENYTYTLLAAGVLGVMGILCLIAFIGNQKDTKKTIAKFEGNLEKLEQEINSSSTMDYKKYKLFLTDHYVITYNGALRVVDYNDIVWLYPKEVTNRGYTTRTTYVVTNDSKMHTVCCMGVNKKTRVEMDEIYQALLLKLPKDALAGYTNENRAKVKDLYTKKNK